MHGTGWTVSYVLLWWAVGVLAFAGRRWPRGRRWRWHEASLRPMGRAVRPVPGRPDEPEVVPRPVVASRRPGGRRAHPRRPVRPPGRGARLRSIGGVAGVPDLRLPWP